MDKDHQPPDRERETHPIVDLVRILDALAAPDTGVLRQLDESVERLYRTLEDMGLVDERLSTLETMLRELHHYLSLRLLQFDE